MMTSRRIAVGDIMEMVLLRLHHHQILHSLGHHLHRLVHLHRRLHLVHGLELKEVRLFRLIPTTMHLGAHLESAERLASGGR